MYDLLDVQLFCCFLLKSVSDIPIFWDDQDASDRIKYLILIGATLSAALHEVVNFKTNYVLLLCIGTKLTLNIVIKKPLITISQPLKKTVQHFIFILFRLVWVISCWSASVFLEKYIDY